MSPPSETHWVRTAEYYAVPWRGKWATELGGVLMTHSIHLHDMLTYLMGPIAGLFGRVATRVNDIEVEDCASASLLMENGALATHQRDARLAGTRSAACASLLRT